MLEEIRRIWQAGLPVLKSDDSGLILTHFITTEHLDRYGEIVLADGATVPPNGVRVLWMHGGGGFFSPGTSRGSLPVGKPLSVAPDKFKGARGLIAQTQFYQPGTAGITDQFPALVYDMHKQGYLDGWSIGFTSEMSEKRLKPGPEDRVAPEHPTDEDFCLHHVKWTLLEYSSVAIPANPYAMGKAFSDAVKSGRIKQDELEHWIGRECQHCGHCESDPQQVAIKPSSGLDIGLALQTAKLTQRRV